MAACHNGHKDVVQLLLNYPEKTIELNGRDNDGEMAFLAACLKWTQRYCPINPKSSRQNHRVKRKK